MPAGIVSSKQFCNRFDGASDMTDTQAVHAPPNTETEPVGEVCIRTLAMPADANQNGDIFGGWLLSQMDLAGGVFASKIAKSRTVTVAIEAMNFRKPVFVGDLVSVHSKSGPDRQDLDHRPSRGLGAAPQGNAFDPGDRRQFHLRLDRRFRASAGHPAGRSANSGVILVLRCESGTAHKAVVSGSVCFRGRANAMSKKCAFGPCRTLTPVRR